MRGGGSTKLLFNYMNILLFDLFENLLYSKILKLNFSKILTLYRMSSKLYTNKYNLKSKR